MSRRPTGISGVRDTALMTMMKTLFTAEATSIGGRSGSITDPAGLLEVALGNPLEAGAEKRGPNPELLFGAAYAACFHGAMINAAKARGIGPTGSTVRAVVGLLEDGAGGYRLSVALHGRIPGTGQAVLQEVMAAAHETCPYSKAMRGEVSVTLVAA